MPDFRVLWTALPRAADNDNLVVDVYTSHRLGVDEPPTTTFTLSDFPEVVDWPAQVAGHLSFDVEFSPGGPAVSATRVPLQPPESAIDLDSPTWGRLFPSSTEVEPWSRRSPRGRPLFSFPADALTDYLRDLYRQAGQTSLQPTGGDALGSLVQDAGALLDTRVDAERAEPTSETHGGETTGGGPGPAPQGCLRSFLTAPLAFLLWLLRWLRRRVLGGPDPGPFPQALGPQPPPVSVTPKVVTYRFPPPGPAPIPPALGAIEQYVADAGVTPPAGWTPPGSPLSAGAVALASMWRFYRRPESRPASTEQPDVTLVPPRPTVPEWDFHRRVGALGDYPVLLLRLGLVVRLRVPRPTTAPASVRVIPKWDGQPLPQRDITPSTSCVLDGNRFLPKPRSGSELKDGVIDLTGASDTATGPSGFRLLVVDTDGAALKAVHTAASLMRRLALRARGLVRDQDRAEGLAGLRTGGIAVVRSGRAQALKAQLDLLESIVPPGQRDAPDEVFADEVVRGFRVEVRDVTPGPQSPWRSLCKREGTYRVLDGTGAVLDAFSLVDQGYVKRSAASSADAASSPLYVHEAIVRWTGWSLVAPRPGRPIKPFSGTRAEPDGRVVPTQDDRPVVPVPEVDPRLRLSTTFRPVDGTLPRLRFGRTYRFRLPWVDLAGETVALSPAAAVSDDVVYRRFEPLGPPALLPLREYGRAESLERLVIRSDVDRSAETYTHEVLRPIDPNYEATATRHVFPAKITQHQAEQHGMLDRAIGSTDPGDLAWGWEVSLRADNSFATPSLRVLDHPGTAVPFGAPGSAPIEGSAERYPLNRHDGTLPTPYLPDPWGEAVALRSVPGAADLPSGGALTATAIPGTAEPEYVCHVPLGGSGPHWPGVPSFRLRVMERPGTVDPATGVAAFAHPTDPPHWDPAARLLTIFLPKGAMADIPFSTVPAREHIDSLGPVAWLDAPSGIPLRRHVELGCHWMVSPARTMRVVHAVQRPLAPPALTTALADKALGATVATITGVMRVHPATTGHVTLLAEWTDQTDDGVSSHLISTAGDAVLDTLTVPMPLADGTPVDPAMPLAKGSLADTAFPPTLPPGEAAGVLAPRHEFGDTKHRLVRYRLRGTTRFREYFPELLAGADAFARTGSDLTVSVPNSSPPPALAVRYLLPSFGWDNPDPTPPTTWTAFTRTRSGGGVRVFMDRPWFLSGPGERLGVVVPRPGQQLDPLVGPQLGADPTWSGLSKPAMPTLEASMFSGGDVHRDVELEDGTVVDVVGFDPTLEVERNEWYADVTFDMAALPSAYWPFVRLALVRFQPSSVKGAHASKVTLTEFTQLAPDRELTAKVATNDVTVVVRGRQAVMPAQEANLMLIALDEADGTDPDELSWRPVGTAGSAPEVGDSIEARLADVVRGVPDGDGLRWEQTLSMPGPRGDRTLRVIVRELELREADRDVIEERFAAAPAGDPITELLVRKGLVPRVVYADSVRLA